MLFRSEHLTQLSNGLVLAIGAFSTTVELFDPAQGAFTPTGSLPVPQYFTDVVQMIDGTVFVIGGTTGLAPAIINAVEVYLPGQGAFVPAPGLNIGRMSHAATLLPDGRVLVVGGTTAPSTDTATAEIYQLILLANPPRD